MLDASLKSTDKSAQYYHIYFGLTILSEIIIEKYIGYFPHNYLESFKMIAKAFLNDPSLQPEKTSQFKQVLISLKNTARAILWQIQEYENQETKPLNWTDFYTSNKSDTDQVQKQKNQLEQQVSFVKDNAAATIERLTRYREQAQEKIEKLEKKLGVNKASDA